MVGSLAEHEFEAPDRAGTYTAFAWVRADVDPWLPAIARLLEAPDCERVLVAAGPTRSLDRLPDDDRLEVVAAGSFADTVGSLPEAVRGPVLLMTSPVLVPEMGLGTALEALAGDARVVSVSFLSNAAGHLSFPHRNKPTQYSLEGHDETTLTRLLRSSEPRLDPAPIAAPAGAATLVSRDCLVMTKGPDDVFAGSPEAAVVEMVMRARAPRAPGRARPLDVRDAALGGRALGRPAAERRGHPASVRRAAPRGPQAARRPEAT